MDNLEDEIEEIAEDEDLLSAPSAPIGGAVETTGSKKKFKMNPVDKHYIDILNKSVALREQREAEKAKEDDDKLFCLSLYKEFKKIPEHGRIRTKIQLLEVIQRAQDFYNPPQPTQTYPSFPSNSYNRYDYGANQQRSQHPTIPQDGYSGNFGYNGQSAASADAPHSQSLARATLSPTDTSCQQRNQRPLIPQDGWESSFPLLTGSLVGRVVLLRFDQNPPPKTHFFSASELTNRTNPLDTWAYCAWSGRARTVSLCVLG